MEKTYLKEVGERLCRARIRNELSKMNLAGLAHVSTEAVKNMERGDVPVGIEDAVKICRALNYSVEYMLTGEMGLAELIRCNQKFLELPELDPEKIRAVAQAFWETCPAKK